MPLEVSEQQSDGFELVLPEDKGSRILQIYIPPARESIAIQNLSAAPDSFNNG